jgi:hypothetical protein
VANFIIDINAKHVPGQRRVWRMFPGERYRFLGSFLKNGIVFLELPGLCLPDVRIAEDNLRLNEALHLSRDIDNWIRSYRKYLRSSMTGEPPSKPERELASYAGQSLRRDQHGDLGAVRNLFGAAEAGDLIVVPDRISTRQVMIGEFLDAPEIRVVHSEPEHFLGETTPARRVRWFPAVDELRIPRELASILRIPPAISQVPKTFEASVFESSYGTFYRTNEFSARITIGGQDFDTQNTFDFGSIAKFASVICFANDSRVEEFHASLVNYADVFVSPEYQPAVSLNINSPGVGSLKAATFVPIFFAALFALLATADAAEQPKPSEIAVINSAEADGDPCAAKVSETVRETLKVMGYDQWKLQCERAKRLGSAAQLNVDSQVRKGR